ncbi:MAG TPA: hypothetical protein VGP94_13960, partial [Tepidisphaeraceae bacterium]|nr:hypothetical protein [Tepidisphaeraceae bacterium]
RNLVQTGDYCDSATCPQKPVRGAGIGSEFISRIEPEADRAARHKAALTKALEVVVVVAEAARKDGFYIEFGVNLNQFGQYSIQPPAGLIKRF